MDNEMNVVVVDEQNDALMAVDYNNIEEIAERADRMVNALNKMMGAALKVTRPKDWVIIGGTPYLQESGATKVARLFGISWKINEGYPTCTRDAKGYPTFTYRMTFSFGNTQVEAEGVRNAADEFFTGKDKKSADLVDEGDVKKAAYTNCLNRGIKSILPGLRNLEIEDLEQYGINVGKSGGYTFREKKETKEVHEKKDAEVGALVCSCCGKSVSEKVASYSQGKFGAILCMEHQKEQK